jgi:hypothetical protein
MKSKCCFDLHFFYNQGSWILLCVFTGHLYLFLWEFPIEFMCPFLHWGVDSLGLSCFSSCRFWILVSYSMSIWQRFSHILWSVFWVWWLLLLLCRSSLFILSLRCWAFEFSTLFLTPLNIIEFHSWYFQIHKKYHFISKMSVHIYNFPNLSGLLFAFFFFSKF